LKSLQFISETKARTVLRVTLIRNYNDSSKYHKEFSDLFRKGCPNFIELKSYMHVGMSTNRLEQSNMLEMNEIQGFANAALRYLDDFSVMDESTISRIIVLQNNVRYISRWIDKYAH
jgi:tRNA wybutosine-synthesizing protein 1